MNYRNLLRKSLMTHHNKEKVDIQSIISRTDQEFQETEADAKHEYQSFRDDVKNKVIN